MPCYKCGHSLKDHSVHIINDACGQCDCKEYGASDFECCQCGVGLGESEARAGHDYCRRCADEYNGGSVFHKD